jgi:hypothetical protein
MKLYNPYLNQDIANKRKAMRLDALCRGKDAIVLLCL